MIGVYDPKNPYSDGAQVNSWTPALNATWIWGEDKIFGYVTHSLQNANQSDILHSVNLGGLFVLEPFISPALFQKYPGTIDEWTLSEAMAADTASGGLKQLEDHYNTFIVCSIHPLMRSVDERFSSRPNKTSPKLQEQA